MVIHIGFAMTIAIPPQTQIIKMMMLKIVEKKRVIKKRAIQTADFFCAFLYVSETFILKEFIVLFKVSNIKKPDEISSGFFINNRFQDCVLKGLNYF